MHFENAETFCLILFVKANKTILLKHDLKIINCHEAGLSLKLCFSFASLSCFPL